MFTNKISLSGIKSLTSDATTSTTTTPSSEAEKIASGEIPKTSADGSEKTTSNTENMSSEASKNALPDEFHPFQIAGANKM